VRIVSLVPSSTETLLALGADVIACTRFCEQPNLLHVGGTKNPDIEAILALDPDLVVMDREENRVDDHDALVGLGVQVFASDVRSVAAATAVVGRLARLAGLPLPLSAPLSEPDLSVRATAFVPIWRRPWMSISAETYGGSLLRHLGIASVTADADVAYPTVDLDDVRTLDPDVVLVPSEPYEFTVAHLDELADALPSAAIRRIDGQDLFWWGIRTTDAIRRLGAVLADVRGPSADR
jgi:ABC-type Fe3+-hydroxamate transport system substrate-binding protein